nr:triose phosphate/phosphate translocator, chloroplastic [Tanacetum cinerariifolium]
PAKLSSNKCFTSKISPCVTLRTSQRVVEVKDNNLSSKVPGNGLKSSGWDRVVRPRGLGGFQVVKAAASADHGGEEFDISEGFVFMEFHVF